MENYRMANNQTMVLYRDRQTPNKSGRKNVSVFLTRATAQSGEKTKSAQTSRQTASRCAGAPPPRRRRRTPTAASYTCVLPEPTRTP